MLVGSGSDRTTRLLDVDSRVLIGSPLPGFENEGSDAAVTPDGQRVIVAHFNGNGLAWRISAGVWNSQACAVAGRKLTRAEWDQFLPDRAYRPAC